MKLVSASREVTLPSIFMKICMLHNYSRSVIAFCELQTLAYLELSNRVKHGNFQDNGSPTVKIDLIWRISRRNILTIFLFPTKFELDLWWYISDKWVMLCPLAKNQLSACTGSRPRWLKVKFFLRNIHIFSVHSD